MIKLKLFDSTETNFKHNKRVLNEASKCDITEDTEGIFQSDLEYPLFDTKNLSKELKKGRIISVNYRERGQQLFRIRRIKKSTKDRKVTVCADCIARADLMTNFVKGIRIKNMTRKQAIAYMLLNLVDKRRKYEVGNLDVNSPPLPEQGIDDAGNVIDYLDIDNVSGLEALNKIKEAYGGEIIFNNFTIDIVDSIGTNKTHKITSTKNLEELEEDIDDTTDDFATAVIPCTSDGLFLQDSEYILYSPNANKYNRYYYKAIKYDDVNFEELAKSASTTEDVEIAKQICYRQLRERVAKEWDNGLDKLKENYTINFIELAKTEEYKDYMQLEQAYLGDKVKTIYSKIGINVESRITKIVYNALLDKVEELEVGAKKNSSIIDNINKVENNLNESIINNGRAISVVKRDVSSRLEHTEEKLQSSINEVITTTEQKFNDTNKLIDENITAIQSNGSNITQLSNKIETEVKSINESMTVSTSNLENKLNNNINKNVSDLQSKINDTNNNIEITNKNINKIAEDNSSKITQLDNKIATEVKSTKEQLNVNINENTSNLQNQINDTNNVLNKNVSNLKSDINNTNNAIVDANKLINKVENDLNFNISSNADTAQNNLNSVKDNLLNVIGDNKTTLKKDIDNVNNRVNTVDGNIITINKNIEDSNSKITQLDNKISSEVASAKKDLNIKIDNTNSNINSVKETVTDMKSKVEQLPNSITSTVAEAKTELQGKINSVDGKVNSTNTTVINQATQIEQLSNKISSSVTKDNFGALVQLNYDSVSVAIANKTNSSAIFDSNGLTINEGKFRINKDGEEYLSIGNNGRVNSRRGYSVYDFDGTEKMSMSRDGLMFAYDDDYEMYIEPKNKRTLGLTSGLHIGKDLDVVGDVEIGDEDDKDSSLYVYGELIVDGDFRVKKKANKNCIEETKNYGEREIYAYETTESYFGDIGNGIIKNGECVVVIDAIFSECVNTNIDYCVFLQEYNGKVSQIKKYPTHFTVYGEENTEFCWELKAKRLTKENDRLELFTEKNKKDKYVVDEKDFLNEIKKLENDNTLENELLKTK